MNTESTPLVPIMVTQTFNQKESTFITTKLLVADTSQEPFLWILNLVPWTLLELVLSVNSSDPTTSFSVKLVLVTTGLRVTTLKVLNSSTQFQMLSEKKLKDAIASKVSKLLTHWVVVPDLVWVPSSSPRLEKNILIELWKPSQSSHHQRSQTQSLNHTTLPSQSTNQSKTLMNAWLLITKLFTISVSEPSSSPPPLMVILTTWSQLLCLVLLAA